MKNKILKSLFASLLVLYSQVSWSFSNSTDSIIDRVTPKIDQYISKGYMIKIANTNVKGGADFFELLSKSHENIEVLSPVIKEVTSYKNFRLTLKSHFKKAENDNLIYMVSVKSNYENLGYLAFSSMEVTKDMTPENFKRSFNEMNKAIAKQIDSKIKQIAEFKTQDKSVSGLFAFVVKQIFGQKAQAVEEFIPVLATVLFLSVFLGVFVSHFVNITEKQIGIYVVAVSIITYIMLDREF